MSSLDECRTQAYENVKLFKEKVKDGMIKGYKNENLMLIIMFYYTIVVLDFFAVKFLSKREGPYNIKEVCHSRAIKINNAEGTNPKVVNGQRVKHYLH